MLTKTQLQTCDTSSRDQLTQPKAKPDFTFTRKNKKAVWSEAVLFFEVKADLKASYNKVFGQQWIES
jgi:hypothetical protein